jgi:hypothetical protein
VIAGAGADAVFGDGGDDWIQGGLGQDLLQGDHGAPFFDDPAETAPGNDIFVGQAGENDYDAEGGDDIMSQNAAIDRNAGAGGFDWAIHQYDTVGGNDDMMINNFLVGVPIQVVVNRDRWQETEADSGSKFNDVIKGTDGANAVPRLIGGAGFTGCDALDQSGVARIKGLAALLPPVAQWVGNSTDVAALSASGVCPLTGPVWGEGDILLGGGGSDTIEGRAGDEIIDGDKSLEVHITVRTDPANPATEIGRTDMMEHAATSGNFGPGTAGMTLQKAVTSGLVDPGNLVAVREIVDPPASTTVSTDTAVFSGPRANYTIAVTGDHLTVTDNVGTDGIDTVRNVERLRFTDQTVVVAVPNAPTNVNATVGNRRATVTWTAPTGNGAQIASYDFVVKSGTTVISTTTGIAPTTSRIVTGLTPGQKYTFEVRAVNQFGAGPFGVSNEITAAGAPNPPTALQAVRGNGQATLSWTPGADNSSAITGYTLQIRNGAAVVETRTLTGNVSSAVIGGLNNGTAYNFRLIAINGVGTSVPSTPSNTVTPATVPGLVQIGAPTQGPVGGALTASANWNPPLSTGGAPITGYRVQALRMAADGTTVESVQGNIVVGATIRTRSFTLPAGTYRFDVSAINAVGEGPAVRSEAIAAR